LDVWRVRFDDMTAADEAGSALGATERQHAARFRFERDRQRFVFGRAYLRRILAGYRDQHPAAIVLTQGPHGKPVLADPEDPLRFNLAHSGAVCLIAVTEGTEIGVDVEELRLVPDGDPVLVNALTPRELALVRSAPPERRDEILLRCWTRKEAVLKASGTGLLARPDLLDAQAEGATLRWPPDGIDAVDYRLFDISRACAIAALAVRDDGAQCVVVERSA
jgi:4'-phosphopantetheinyl transferase